MTCEKKSYDSFSEAQSFLSKIPKGRRYNRKLANKRPKRAYKCEQCGKFHLTSQKKGKW